MSFIPSSSLSKGGDDVQPERIEENKIANKRREGFFLDIRAVK